MRHRAALTPTLNPQQAALLQQPLQPACLHTIHSHPHPELLLRARRRGAVRVPSWPVACLTCHSRMLRGSFQNLWHGLAGSSIPWEQDRVLVHTHHGGQAWSPHILHALIPSPPSLHRRIGQPRRTSFITLLILPDCARRDLTWEGRAVSRVTPLGCLFPPPHPWFPGSSCSGGVGPQSTGLTKPFCPLWGSGGVASLVWGHD